MQVEITSQYEANEKYGLRSGKVFLDSERRGWIGYLDWSGLPGASVGLRTAKLEIVECMYEVYVVPSARTPELHVGQELFEQMVDHLRSLDFNELIVFGAIDSALPFYYHVFDDLVAANVIESYCPVESEAKPDEHNFRLTFTPKHQFLPG